MFSTFEVHELGQVAEYNEKETSLVSGTIGRLRLRRVDRISVGTVDRSLARKWPAGLRWPQGNIYTYSPFHVVFVSAIPFKVHIS